MPRNQERLIELASDINTQYAETLQNGQSEIADLVTTITTPTNKINNIFMLPVSGMKRWKDGRTIRDQDTFDDAYNGISKECLKYESTQGIWREDVDQDRLGVYSNLGNMLGQRVFDHVDELAAAALLNGTTTHKQYISYDGKAIFATDHTLWNGHPQSNLLTASFGADGIKSAWELAMSWRDNHGMTMYKGMKVKPTLVIPTNFWFDAQELALPGSPTNLVAPAVSSNPLYNRFNIVVNAFLDEEPDAWYMAFPTPGSLPILHAVQEDSEPELQQRFDPSDPLVFLNDQFLYGLRTVDHAYIPAWWTIIKSKPTASTYTGTTIKEVGNY